MSSLAPGLYFSEVSIQQPSPFSTGIAGFVGFADVKEGSSDWPSVVPLRSLAEFSRYFSIPNNIQGYLQDAVIGFFANGGTDCYVARASSTELKQDKLVESLKTAIKALATTTEIDIVAIPDAMALVNEDQDLSYVRELQQCLIEQCLVNNCFAILDGYVQMASNNAAKDRENIKNQYDDLVEHLNDPEQLANAALYYPWIKVIRSSEADATPRSVPPSGHIAGVVARTDRTRGVFKAPANEEILDAVDLTDWIDNSSQVGLNSHHINCLRFFPGKGIRVWGVRTLSQRDSWRYINVRRVVLTVKRWIDLNMSWATFEPNTHSLWVRIERELTAFLTQLWRQGGLKGDIAEHAFSVKCDGETNPPKKRDKGEVVTEVRLAPSRPGEFIFIRVVHIPNTTERNDSS